MTKAVYDIAFEFWDNNALQMFKKHATPKAVMENEFPFYVLIETSGSNKDHDDEVCILLFKDIFMGLMHALIEIDYIPRKHDD